MTTDLTALWHTNRRWRAWMDANTKFVTPADDLDTLRYARVEAVSEAKLEYLQLSLAEIHANKAADIAMRERLPGHARNNGRESNLFSELADVAMLLLTVLPESVFVNVPAVYDRHTTASLDAICLHITECVHWRLIDESWEWQANQVLQWIAHYPGLDLAAELDRCWRRLAGKHGADAWADAIGYKSHADRVRFYARLIINLTGLPAPWLVEESGS